MLVGNSKCWSNSTGLSLNFGGDDIRIIQGFVLSHILTDKAILGQAPRSLSDLPLTYCEKAGFGHFLRFFSLNSSLFALKITKTVSNRSFSRYGRLSPTGS